MDREPASGELVPCRLRCILCSAVNVVALPAEARIRDVLAHTSCPTCGRGGGVQLARPMPPPPMNPSRVRGAYSEPPDNEGDEPLLERMKRCRRN